MIFLCNFKLKVHHAHSETVCEQKIMLVDAIDENDAFQTVSDYYKEDDCPHDTHHYVEEFEANSILVSKAMTIINNRFGA